MAMAQNYWATITSVCFLHKESLMRDLVFILHNKMGWWSISINTFFILHGCSFSCQFVGLFFALFCSYNNLYYKQVVYCCSTMEESLLGLHGRPPDYSKMKKLFGCLAYAANTIPYKTNFKPSAEKCLFFFSTRKGYQLFDLATKFDSCKRA